MNISVRRLADFIERKQVLKLKIKAENRSKQRANCKDSDYDVITNDKFSAIAILSANKIKHVEGQVLISNSQIIFKNDE